MPYMYFGAYEEMITKAYLLYQEKNQFTVLLVYCMVLKEEMGIVYFVGDFMLLPSMHDPHIPHIGYDLYPWGYNYSHTWDQ